MGTVILAADPANTIGFARRQGFPSTACPPPDNGTDVVVNAEIVTRIQKQPSSSTGEVGVVFWDTSSIPSNAVVSQVRLLMTIAGKSDVDNRNWVAEWYPGSNAPISPSDYLFTPTGVNQAFSADITAVPASGTHNISLGNLGAFEKAGKTGLRFFIEGGCPPDNNFPNVRLQDTDISRPQLEVTFTLPPGPVARRTRFGGLGALPVESSASGRYLLPGWYGDATGTIALVAGDLYYIPIFVSERRSFDQIAINVTVAGAGGTVARMGIYEMTAAGIPGTRLADFGTVAVDSIGDKIAAITAVLQAYDRNAYFLALVSDGTPTLSTFGATGLTPPTSGQSATVAAAPNLLVPAAPGQSAQATGGLDGVPTQPTVIRSGQFAAVRLRGV